MADPIPSKRLNRVARIFAKEAQRLDGVEGIFVFGSVAANVATPESDIDIVISWDEKSHKNWLKIQDLTYEFNKRKSSKVRVCTMPTETIKNFLGGETVTGERNHKILLGGLIPLFLSKKAFPERAFSRRELIKKLRPIKEQIIERYFSEGRGFRRVAHNKKRNQNRFLRK